MGAGRSGGTGDQENLLGSTKPEPDQPGEHTASGWQVKSRRQEGDNWGMGAVRALLSSRGEPTGSRQQLGRLHGDLAYTTVHWR